MIESILLELSKNFTVLGKLEAFWDKINQSLSNEAVIATIIELGNESPRLSLLHQYTLRKDRGTKFTVVVKLTAWLIEHVAKSLTTTFRDIYYQDVELFQRNQNNANRHILLMMESLGVTMDDLKIYPSQKGLVYCMSHTELIPFDFSQWLQNPQILLQKPQAIVILEKDAVFQSLIAYLKENTIGLSLVVITGKGFPDRLTLRFTKALHSRLPNVPVLGFVDSDVYGISIMNQYYLHGIPIVYCGTFLVDFEERIFQTISERDARIAIGQLLRWESYLNDGEHTLTPRCQWKRELCRGLVLRKKAEMNTLSANVIEFIIKRVIRNITGDTQGFC